MAMDFTANYPVDIGPGSSTTINGTFLWNGKPVIDDEDGLGGVREPRRPISPIAPAAAALQLEPDFCFA